MNESQGLGATSVPVDSVIGSFAGDVSARGQAAPRHNLALRGCRLCGTVTLTRARDDVVLSASRAPAIMQVLYLVTLLGFVFAVSAAFLLSAPFLPGVAPSINWESDARAMNIAWIVAVSLFALNAVVMQWSGRGSIEDVRVRRTDLRVSRSGRSYVFHGPLGRNGKKAIMVLKPASKADKDLMAKVLE